MTSINVTNASKNLYKLIEEVNNSSIPITITNSIGSKAVLISEKDYKAIQETTYLHSVPGLIESILKADKEDPKKMKKYNSSIKW